MATKQKRFKPQYLPLFWDDLNSAVTYISDVLHATEAAERLIDQVENGILEHLHNPTMAAMYQTTQGRPLTYYWFEVGNYMVFYVIFDDVIEVRRFVYGSRDLTKMIP